MADVLLQFEDGLALMYKFIDNVDKKRRRKLFKSFENNWENILQQLSGTLEINDIHIKWDLQKDELLLPENSPSVLENLLASDINQGMISLGVEPFPLKFYNDIYNLFADNNGDCYNPHQFIGFRNILVSGLRVEGYGNACAEFKKKGIEWHVEWYEEDEEW